MREHLRRRNGCLLTLADFRLLNEAGRGFVLLQIPKAAAVSECEVVQVAVILLRRRSDPVEVVHR